MQTSSGFAPEIIDINEVVLTTLPEKALTDDLGHHGMNLIQGFSPRSPMWMMKVTLDGPVD